MKIELKIGTNFKLKSEGLAELNYLSLLSEKMYQNPHGVMVISSSQGYDDEQEEETIELTLSFFVVEADKIFRRKSEKTCK